MEEGAVLVKEAEKKIPMKIEDRKLYIGDMPQLIVDLETQENYIRTEERLISYKKRIERLISYKKRIELSPDLLAGKRANVLQTALEYYYTQACEIAEGIKIAEEYRQKANTTIREKR